MRIFLIVSIIFGMTGSTILFAQPTKVNIAVLDLDPTGISIPDAQFLSDRLRTELFETDRFQVIERDKMNEILSEQGFQQSGCTSVQCAVEIGQLLNVNIMTAGSIGKIEDIYSISIRMISVESGAIVKTATRDYEGKLSEILTDVIPEIAMELSQYESSSQGEIQEGKEVEIRKIQQNEKTFGILLLGGFSSLTYTSEINDKIQEINAYIAPDIEDFSAHILLGLELRYTFSLKWCLKLGLIAESISTPWQASLSDYTSPVDVFQSSLGLEVERKNRFVNTYLGINYSIWTAPGRYDIYLGADLGSVFYAADLTYSYAPVANPVFEDSKTYDYSSFALKLSLGGNYFISKAFSLGVNIIFKNVQPFDTSDQTISEDFPDELKPFFLPDEINASGIELAFSIGYHF